MICLTLYFELGSQKTCVDEVASVVSSGFTRLFRPSVWTRGVYVYVCAFPLKRIDQLERLRKVNKDAHVYVYS